MKKNLARKLSLSRETLLALDDARNGNLHQAMGGGTDTTCFETCNCRSGRTCLWSECGCLTPVC